ncbi:uncharacterized protein LOC128884279 isoform X2 [Hylaeus volcanicus]|uniref:uncharacterized protein LOC128884279 isoform X2 n=1 Tax=Hylaeus volcanicus TaxID=313075 RepID=UPI0023B7A4AF|nr:uncharacterized protein LOC128884279 isoform X2 [Hylaeus volcanicus]
MPLSRMVPTNSVYRVNATVYVSNKHHPRVVFYNSSNIDRFMQRNGNHARETIPYRICYPKKNTNLVFTIKMGVESKQVVFLNNNYSEFILPNFRRSSKNECALESIESIRLYPDLEKFKREILNQPNVIENLVNFHTHNKNYNLRMIFLNSPLIFSDCFLTCSIPMKFQRTTKHDIKNKQDVLWRWRSLQPKGIVGLIQDEENSLQAFQNEHDEENKKKENAVKSHNETVPHKENVNVESIVDKVLEKTETQGGARLASYEGMQQFNDMLKGVARVWLQKWWHIGQCIRDYERLCPLNWERSVEEMCVPPSDYKGPCAATSLKRASYTVKENFSISCEVDWPCIHSTALNARYNCPKRWENPGGALCIAPNDYSGKCSPATDFTGFSIEEKSQWASICDVDWFVKGSNNDEKTRSKTAWSSSLSIGKNERNGPINPSTGVIVLDSKHESFAI